MNFGSLFAGIGGFDLGFQRAGLTPTWQVEICQDAGRVLRQHWPDAQLREDVRMAGKHNLPRVDLICGGFPCQDLSIAGKRAGLGGERSGLFYQMTRVINELRPAVLVWENVPGLLSSRSGRDFLAVLVELDRIGYSGAWRTLDAQHFGVPQRRRRVFGVFLEGHSGGQRAAEILSLAEGSGGDSPAGGEERKDVAFCLAASVGRTSDGSRIANAWNTNYVPQTAFCLPASGRGTGDGHGQGWNSNYVAHALTAEGFDASEDGTGRGTPLVPFTVHSAGSCAKERHAFETDTAKSLDTTGGFASGQGGTVVAAIRENMRGEVDYCRDNKTYSVTSGGGKPGQGYQAAQIGSLVRRLTPVECCRLQGFPDDWLDLDPSLSDSAKYRLLGNAVAVPVAEWVGRQIAERF